MKKVSCECCILGAGPAGLGVASELVKHGIKDICIIDKNAQVGGLSRTEVFDSYRFDVGPHRFFTNNEEINRLWHQTLGSDFIPVDRLTRIFYKKKYFNYPIKAFDALLKMGPVESAHALVSFAAAKSGVHKEAQTFEEWITQKFGRKLYETFFKTYTEKVWGIPCSQIGAEWAAQRIKGLDIIEVLKSALLPQRSKKIKTLVEQFDYPRLGAGQMYEAMCEQALKNGGKLMLNTTVSAFNKKDNSITSVEVVGPDGEKMEIQAAHFFNSIPLTHFFKLLQPQMDTNLKNAVESLYYRDHITVNLLIDKDELFPDQWIYVHDQSVKMARLANYNNFSKAMVNGENKTAVSVEYFVFQKEDIWKMGDADLKQLAVDELDFLGLVQKEAVEQSWVVRETESYPTYYLGFKEHYERLKQALNLYANISPVGRGGLYKYNNQDHSTMSGILAARNYVKAPGSPFNIWDINIDAEYHESAVRK